jgi:glycosyltransferase involved in cell wall biosynthesis
VLVVRTVKSFGAIATSARLIEHCISGSVWHASFALGGDSTQERSVESDPGGAIDRPLLSVVIPTRNRNDVICRSVQSVLCSPRADIEVVVVDDGSFEPVTGRVSGIDDQRLRLHRLESNGNANRARNTGARLSRSDLIAFLDSDDLFRPDRVDRLIDFFTDSPDVDCLVDGYVEFSRGGERKHLMPPSMPGPPEIRQMLLAHLIPLTNSAITVRRSAFEAIGGYDEAMPRHQDREFLMRMARAHSIRFGNGTDVEKHRGSRSISHEFDGYIGGLDALAARAPDYYLPENEQIFRYLIARGIVKAIASGKWAAALREFQAWRRAKNLPKDYLNCLRAYRLGRRQRILAQVKG